jgi:hypothetical protein
VVLFIAGDPGATGAIDIEWTTQLLAKNPTIQKSAPH